MHDTDKDKINKKELHLNLAESTKPTEDSSFIVMK
jgi:hypothetical protein